MNEYTTPLILTCPVTGRKQKLYHKPYIDQQIKKYGSLEQFIAQYVAKGVKKKETAVAVPKPVSTDTVQVVAAKVSFNDIKPEPSRTITVGTTIDGEPQTCTVYENYDK